MKDADKRSKKAYDFIVTNTHQVNGTPNPRGFEEKNRQFRSNPQP